MSQQVKTLIKYLTLIILGLYFLFWGLVKAEGFLAPITVAVLFAMVVLPICKWFEGKGWYRGWASLVSALIILLFFVLLASLIGTQIKSLASDWPEIKERAQPKIERLQEYITERTGFTVEEQKEKLGLEAIVGEGNSDKASSPDKAGSASSKGKEVLENNDDSESSDNSDTESAGSSVASSAGSFIVDFLSFIGTFLLVFIYTFFFLFYRDKFSTSILKMVPEEKQDKAKKVIDESGEVSQSYLFGRLILIFCLAVLYTIGLTASGVEHAILISVIAAFLSLVPYIGNIIGYVLALSLAFVSGTGATGAIGVTITFSIAQFVESYILEPYVVGDKVNLNPVITILVVVLGEAVWGVMGMLLAIPVLGIVKVICDHVPVLRPIGYLFGAEDIGDDDDDDKDGYFDRLARWGKNIFKSKS